MSDSEDEVMVGSRRLLDEAAAVATGAEDEDVDTSDFAPPGEAAGDDMIAPCIVCEVAVRELSGCSFCK